MSAVLHHAQVSPAAKLVLLGIANHQGDQGAYPSRETLAKYANVSTRSVTRYVEELKMRGYLEVEEQAGRNGVNVYWVTITCPDDCDRSTNHRTSTLAKLSTPWTEYAPPLDSSVHPPWTTVSNKPSINLKRTNTKNDKKTPDELHALRARRLEQAQQIQYEINLAKSQAVDSPTCEHGLSLIKCIECCKALAN
jgi:DNA-binding transcriptional MocR family regulator